MDLLPACRALDLLRRNVKVKERQALAEPGGTPAERLLRTRYIAHSIDDLHFGSKHAFSDKVLSKKLRRIVLVRLEKANPYDVLGAAGRDYPHLESSLYCDIRKGTHGETRLQGGKLCVTRNLQDRDLTFPPNLGDREVNFVYSDVFRIHPIKRLVGERGNGHESTDASQDPDH
ncbi:MAG TPA: hypothetical protein VLN59_11125 [Burkholderiales bacterium]|nr:hypothetical protein [Burkholderiales bacterium]